MAKITTITNPLTGQPAQVDQLDHTAQEIDDAIARALPGGAIDIALANNDPRQWGLGKSIGCYCSDCNSDLKVGLYYIDANTANGPGVTGVMLVEKESSDYGINTYQTIKSGAIEVRRYYSSWASKWLPWEWLNPPMLLGVEYRTIFRYLGKPVYVMAISFGSLPNATTKDVEHGIANIEYAIYAGGTTSNGGTIPYHSDWTNIDVGANKYTIFIKTAENQSDKTAITWVVYIKTTD